MLRRALTPAIVFGLLSLIPSARAEFIVGQSTLPGGLLVPFGSQSAPLEFQQLYSASYFFPTFSGPITINQLYFYNRSSDPQGSVLDTATYEFSLSTSSRQVSTLSGTFSDNIGADNKVVFTGRLGGPVAFGGSLVINLTSDFRYDPRQGSLLLDIKKTNLVTPAGTYEGTVDTFEASRVGVVFSNGSSNLMYRGTGLVTGFGIVPEPSSLALVGSGLLAVAMARSCRRKAVRP